LIQFVQISSIYEIVNDKQNFEFELSQDLENTLNMKTINY